MKKIAFALICSTLIIPSYSQEKRSAEEAGGVQAGIEAPQFTAVDADNKRFDLYEALENGPVVLMFYRGNWCPVCNKHLAQIQDSLSLITEKGVTVIAVSPEKTGAEFRLLFDDGYKISDAYDVTFSPKKQEDCMASV